MIIEKHTYSFNSYKRITRFLAENENGRICISRQSESLFSVVLASEDDNGFPDIKAALDCDIEGLVALFSGTQKEVNGYFLSIGSRNGADHYFDFNRQLDNFSGGFSVSVFGHNCDISFSGLSWEREEYEKQLETAGLYLSAIQGI